MVDTPLTESTEVLLHCMRQRRDVLLALRLLTDSQQAAARSADVNVTLGILARKESLLDELSVIRDCLAPFHHEDPEQRRWLTAARRQECQQLADEGDRLLRETAQIEEATLFEMMGHRDAIAAQLQDGTDSILAHNAYTAGEQLGDSALDLSNL